MRLANTASQVICNVINGIKGRNISIVLQHDIKKFSVDAVEEIIQWGLSRRIYIPSYNINYAYVTPRN